jgi:hypothetical protein
VALHPFIGPWFVLQFRNIFYTDGRTPWTRDQPVAMPVPTHRTTQTHNKRTQTSMPWVGLEPTIPVSERAKRVHTLDRAAAVIGSLNKLLNKNYRYTSLLWVYLHMKKCRLTCFCVVCLRSLCRCGPSVSCSVYFQARPVNYLQTNRMAPQIKHSPTPCYVSQ